MRRLIQMGQLSDVELCNNVVFLLHHSPESILSKSNDHFWCGLADAVVGNVDPASIRIGIYFSIYPVFDLSVQVEMIELQLKN